MRKGICCIAALVGAMGMVTDATATPENIPTLAPLTAVTAVHIGGEVSSSNNPYLNINNILKHLGIASSAVEPHRHHFHVYLQPPELLPITQNLLAGTQTGSSVGTEVIETSQRDVRALQEYAQAIITGEELMLIMDVPPVPPQSTPIVLAQASTASAAPQPDYILNNCQETEHTGDPQSALRSIDPAAALQGYFIDRDNKLLDLALFKPSLLQGTQHGKITEGVDNLGFTSYRYDPNPGYLGDDQAMFMVEFEGKRYKLIYQIKVMEYVPDNTTCPPPKLIKVTKPSSGDSGFGSGYSLGSVGITIADLAGGALGQTTGSTVTLDTNAAGYNWFIDPTPADNSEFLPTSNPNEWVAKAGSAAAGKMDMLSVLLHEYGHALGINHSADPNDFMGTTLTAGVRRLPTADEMALMQSLVAQAKVGLAESTPSLTLPLQQR